MNTHTRAIRLKLDGWNNVQVGPVRVRGRVTGVTHDYGTRVFLRAWGRRYELLFRDDAIVYLKATYLGLVCWEFAETGEVTRAVSVCC